MHRIYPVSVRLNHEEHELFEGLARKYNRSLSDVLRLGLRAIAQDTHFLERVEKKLSSKEPQNIFDPEKHWFSSMEFIECLLTKDDYLMVSILIDYSGGFANLNPGIKVIKENDWVIFKVTEENEVHLDVNTIKYANIWNPDTEESEPYSSRKLNDYEHIFIQT